MKTRLMLVAALAVATFAQPGPQRRGPGPGPNPGQPPTPDALKTALGLTDTQLTSLTQLQETKRTQLETIVQQIAEKQRAIQTALRSDNPDANAIAALLVQVATLQKQLKSLAGGYLAQAQAILNADQKTKLKDLEKAQSLIPAVRQAEGLDLLARPEGAGPIPMGPGLGMGVPGGPGPMMMRRSQ